MSNGERDDEERERKAKVLHARIPEALEEELKRRAGTLGITVSNLVRNVLVNALGLVEDVVADAADVARRARGEDAPQPPPPGAAGPTPEAPSRVLGWQEVTLNVNAVCDKCNALLPRGSAAAFGVLERPGPRVTVCPKCLKEAIDA